MRLEARLAPAPHCWAAWAPGGVEMADARSQAWPQVVLSADAPTRGNLPRRLRARDISFVAMLLTLTVGSVSLPVADPDSYFVQASRRPVELASWLDTAPAAGRSASQWAVQRAWALNNMDAFAAAAAACTQLFTIMIAGAAMPSMGESVRGR